MKKTFILSTLLAVALAAGILFVSCDTPTSSKGDDKDSNNSGGNGGSVISNGGDTLKLSGQVYRLEQNYDSNDITTSISITPYTGPDKNFTYRGGTGSIRNGQFSFTIGIPDSLESSFFMIENPALGLT